MTSRMMQLNTEKSDESQQAPASPSLIPSYLQTNNSYAGLCFDFHPDFSPSDLQGVTDNQPFTNNPQFLTVGATNTPVGPLQTANFWLCDQKPEIPTAVLPKVENGAQANQKDPLEDTQKRQLRLRKNREAARDYRRRRNAYIAALEKRVVKLEQQNTTLAAELRVLKSLHQNNMGSFFRMQ
ncbi:cyclic AMP-dependent transcription factor ATF-1 [Oryzias latipes]|uniref:cyclic AMP-dependent transcription factor ATF-1 n=1 Tax=Oryzias latipes TaxID=8090 RepID=UPI0002A4A3E4|nr:cyclic AMP-dependent transcription factor ATF-1 [Oryzias latipes]XP_020568457.1 cyclic AMP-dependent transcription factor ATF-1 [Oryzias latipes]XP_020568458.1 cyclic AMP-dependent transcription factor ATF-1 [Oryzias latipes]